MEAGKYCLKIRNSKYKLSLFSIRYLEGGAETGFRHVEPVEYKPRLLQFNGKGRHITVKEVRGSIILHWH